MRGGAQNELFFVSLVLSMCSSLLACLVDSGHMVSLGMGFLMRLSRWAMLLELLGNISVQLYIVKNPSSLGDEGFDTNVMRVLGGIPFSTGLISVVLINYAPFEYYWLRGNCILEDCMGPLYVLASNIAIACSIFVFLGLRTCIRQVEYYYDARSNHIINSPLMAITFAQVFKNNYRNRNYPQQIILKISRSLLKRIFHAMYISSL